MIPQAFAAERGNRIVRLDSGHDDAGAPIAFEVESAAVAPAGVGGDCDFDRVRLVVTSSAPATLSITPVLDGEALDGSRHTITLPAAPREQTRVYELVLRRVSSSGRTYGVRGTWLSLRIAGTLSGGGRISIEPAQVDFDVLSPTQERP